MHYGEAAIRYPRGHIDCFKLGAARYHHADALQQVTAAHARVFNAQMIFAELGVRRLSSAAPSLQFFRFLHRTRRGGRVGCLQTDNAALASSARQGRPSMRWSRYPSVLSWRAHGLPADPSPGDRARASVEHLLARIGKPGRDTNFGALEDFNIKTCKLFRGSAEVPHDSELKCIASRAQFLWEKAYKCRCFRPKFIICEDLFQPMVPL